MAVIKEYKNAAGVTIVFNNEAYIKKSEAEKEDLREDINSTISKILLKN